MIVYCRAGMRSLMAAQALNAGGYQAVSLAGGMLGVGGRGAAARAAGRHRRRPRAADMSPAQSGPGWASANLDDLGEGPGFRKIRSSLGVEAFGVNAIVLPPGIATGAHYHERQEELYFVHAGEIEFEFGDGSRHAWAPAGSCASTPRRTARSVTSATATRST